MTSGPPSAHGDFETRSCCNLKKQGSYIYASDPTTEILCFAWAIGDEEPSLWLPGRPNPQRLFDHIAAGGVFVGHNSGGFEVPIWNTICARHYGWPVLPVAQVRDTMAMAYAQALPCSLENCANALGGPDRKDDEGHKLMLRMCAPRRIVSPGDTSYEKDAETARKDPRTGTFLADGSLAVWWFSDEMLTRMGEYCRQDVIVERNLEKRLMHLSAYENQVWTLDNQINSTGVYVDIPAVKVAQKIVDLEKARLNREMIRATGGAVPGFTKVMELTDWTQSQGVQLDGVAKADLLALLRRDDLPANVRRALEIRQEGAKSSLAKLNAMIAGAGPDNRVRGTLQYHGTSTGRFSGRRLQTTNLPKPILLNQPEIDGVFELLASGGTASDIRDAIALFYGAPIPVLADCVRGFICAPPGKTLIAADLSAIEARSVAWQAGQEDVVQAFAASDRDKTIPDAYCQAAAPLFGRLITKKDKPERTTGKTCVLALGYGGGVGALAKMAKTYGVDMAPLYDTVWSISSEEQHKKARDLCKRNLSHFPEMDEKFFLASDITKQIWRAHNQETVAYWYAMEDAAINAMAYPGKMFSAGAPGRECKFRKSGSFLWMQLPGKRCLCYPYPEVHEAKTPWGKMKPQLTYMGVDSLTKHWKRESTYSSKIVENATQAICRDILVPALMTLNARGYYTPQHVYDEAVCEVPENFGSVEEVERIMTTPPAWAKGFPIAAEGWRGKRYRK